MSGRGFAKIILIGEHSVVYGHPALAIPFPALQSKVMLASSHTFWLTSKYYDGPLSNANSVMSGLKALTEALIAAYNLINPVHITITSELPEKSGLGSSASVAKALISAFDHYYSLGLTQNDYFHFLQISENIYHAKASGIDASTLIYEQAISYEQGIATPFKLNIDGYLMVIHSGTNSATRDAVQMVNANPNKDVFINELGRLTLLGKTALLNNDFSALAQIFNAAHEQLRALQLSNNTLESIRNLLFEKGASGVKITGGGMGGCLIALFASKEKAKDAILFLHSYKYWLINLREVV